MIKKYSTELEGQKDFYNDYLPLIDRTLTLDDVFQDNTDGVLNGNILEFKLNINDLNSVLFQTIKYLSSMRVKGKPIPSNIILISLNDAVAYLYKSEEYIVNIEKLYSGSASKDNEGFIAKSYHSKFEYGKNPLEQSKLIALLKEKCYTKIHIDENCIVGWAAKYYAENPSARKADFIGDLKGKVKIIGEIREPNKFKEFIYPYEGETNTKFQYLMDKLNDDMQKKNLGAFYTHPLYAEKSLELVREAIRRVPKGNDYVIIDRCAGTGNLEKHLTDEELSHTIVSTFEYYEYKVLSEILGDKVKHLIPPIEVEDTFNMGLVRGADALSEEFVNNPIIKQYIDNPKCTIILFENPPYAETNGTTKISGSWKTSYVVQEMKKEVKGSVLNDLGNAFIWSAFKYYLRQDTDSYIVYSPVKYWKAQHLINKEFVRGFAFNRKHFHAPTPACIMVALWSNKDDNEVSEFKLKAYDINIDNKFDDCGYLDVKRIYSRYSQIYYDKRDVDDADKQGILAGLDGLEKFNGGHRTIPIYNKNVVGYLVANSTGFDNPRLNSGLTTIGRYDGNGFYLFKDNYLEKLPIFAASRYTEYEYSWTVMSMIMKSADGADKYYQDVRKGILSQFLLKCLLFTTICYQNHMRTFTGSDGRFYRNELCLDTTNGETIASNDIKGLELNEKERLLIEQWNNILQGAKETVNYNPKLTYGLYQIDVELNTYHKDIELKKNIYDYPELNGNIRSLKKLLKEYYNTELVPTLFEYEFLK